MHFSSIIVMYILQRTVENLFTDRIIFRQMENTKWRTMGWWKLDHESVQDNKLKCINLLNIWI